MCGRYTLTDPGDELIRHFQLSGLPAEYTPRYNIAPTQPVLAVIGADGRRAGMLRWGLIPGWAKDPAIGNCMINADSVKPTGVGSTSRPSPVRPSSPVPCDGSRCGAAVK